MQRRFSFQVDDVHRHDIAGIGALIADHRNVAFRAHLYCIGPVATGHDALRVSDSAAVDRQNGNAMIAVAGD